MDLRGARVLITGGSRGIGKAIAERAAAAGAHVILVARNEALVKEVATSLGGTAHACDLSDVHAVRGLLERVETDGGPVDVLVNNAGLDGVGALERMSADDVADTLHVNLLAPLELTRQVLPGMVARGRGHVVNVSSYAAATMFPGGTTYAASKAGLSHFTEVLRWELKGTGVGVTVVELGPIPTDMLANVGTYRPTEAGFQRAYKLQLLVDIPAETVAEHVIAAVEKNRRAVRLPRRAALLPLLRAAPQRLVRVVSAGIPNR